MTPQTFIFIGRSGSGKGEQAELLQKYLEKRELEEVNKGKNANGSKEVKKVFHITTGDLMRAYAKNENTYTSRIIKESLEKGLLMPDFFAVLMWGTFFAKNLTGNEHIICDGMPRKLHEAMMLVNGMKFYKREKPIVFFLDVSMDSVVKRLQNRGRYDDKKMEVIEERQRYYKNDVVPVIEYFKNSPDCVFMKIDGELPIPEIHKDIISKLVPLEVADTVKNKKVYQH